MNCEGIRQRLIEYVYEELTDEARGVVTAHLNRCGECRTEYESLRRTVARLDAWSPIEAPSNAAFLARAATARPSRPTRLRRLRPWLAGMAAGLVFFAGLVALAAEVRVGDGRLVLAFGEADHSTMDPALRALLETAVAQETSFVVDAVEGQLQQWLVDQDRRHHELIRAIERGRAEDLQRVARALFAVIHETAEEDRRMRDALSGVVELVTRTTMAPNPDNESIHDREYIP